MIQDKKIQELQDLINNANKIVFFGGAGVSTESGIPDFRSEQGIYNTVKNFGYPPEQILSHSFFMKNPEKFYDFYRSTMIYHMKRCYLIIILKIILKLFMNFINLLWLKKMPNQIMLTYT